MIIQKNFEKLIILVIFRNSIRMSAELDLADEIFPYPTNKNHPNKHIHILLITYIHIYVFKFKVNRLKKKL